MGTTAGRRGIIYQDNRSRLVAPTGTKGGYSYRFMSPTGTNDPFSAAQRAGNRDHWSRLVAPTGTKGVHWYRLVPPTETKDLAPRCGGMFSPTSLVEGRPEWFISADAHNTSSSSQPQAFIFLNLFQPKTFFCIQYAPFKATY